MYYVYIMTNKMNTVLYTGVTNNLERRVKQHKSKIIEGFTKKYNIGKLVYFEAYEEILDALRREKQLKKGSRVKKMDLIINANPSWRDLFDSL